MLKKLKKIKPFLYNCKKEFILIIVLSILSTLITAFNPYIYGLIINNILVNKFKYVIYLAIIVGFVQFLAMIFNVNVSKCYLMLRKKMILNIRKKVCHFILNFNMDTYEKNGVGVFLNKIKDDSTRLSVCFGSIKDNIFIAFGNVTALFIIFFINKVLGFYYIICTIILLIIRYYGISKSLYYKSLNLECLDSNTNLLNQLIKGVKDIKLLNLKENFISKADISFENISELEYKSNYYSEFSEKICRFLETVFQGIMIFISISLIKNNIIETSTFILVFMYRNNVFTFSNKLALLINNIRQFNLSLNRILSILEYETEKYGNVEIGNCNGNIVLENVSFKYGDKTILENINLKIKANSFVSIIGKSGIGKTTILSLISKIIEPNNGTIYLDDYKLQELTENSIRSSISLVTQNPFLFNLSIKENLSIVDDNMKHIKEVCKKVGLSEKIESLKCGYDTILNEDATNLSGGEKQKLAIARCLLANCKVILLDEITNNLDTQSKNDIKNILKELKGKYTIVLVTHDLEMTEYSDRVISLEKGKIVEK